MNALIAAQKRGVTVKILWSYKPDLPLIKKRRIHTYVKLLIMGLLYMGIKRNVPW